MNKRLLLGVIIAAIVAVVAVWAVIDWSIKQEAVKLQGKLVFADTFDLGDRVNKIIITTPSDVIELYQKKSFWYILNKGGYFADFELMHVFLSAINKSIYSVRLPYDEKNMTEKHLLNPLKNKKNGGVLIQTYIDEKMLDEIIIGLPDRNGKYFFARNPQSKEIWLIDGNFNLPIKAKDWLLHPVLSIPLMAVEKVTIDNKYVQRKNKNSYFVTEKGNTVNINSLLNVLSAVIIIDAKNEFNHKAYNERVIDVITFYGLEVICKIYYDKEEVWVNINLTTTSLPMKQVNNYIRDNRFLYDGWFFRISPEQAHILRDFYLF